MSVFSQFNLWGLHSYLREFPWRKSGTDFYAFMDLPNTFHHPLLLLPRCHWAAGERLIWSGLITEWGKSGVVYWYTSYIHLCWVYKQLVVWSLYYYKSHLIFFTLISAVYALYGRVDVCFVFPVPTFGSTFSSWIPEMSSDCLECPVTGHSSKLVIINCRSFQ